MQTPIPLLNAYIPSVNPKESAFSLYLLNKTATKRNTFCSGYSIDYCLLQSFIYALKCYLLIVLFFNVVFFFLKTTPVNYI